jgi:hypothetical protein
MVITADQRTNFVVVTANRERHLYIAKAISSLDGTPYGSSNAYPDPTEMLQEQVAQMAKLEPAEFEKLLAEIPEPFRSSYRKSVDEMRSRKPAR